MFKKLAFLLLFIFLVITQAILNATDSNDITEYKEFLYKGSCEIHNLDNEICKFIKLIYSFEVLDSIYVATILSKIAPNQPQPENYAYKCVRDDLMQKICKSLETLSDENIEYILRLRLMYRDVYTGQTYGVFSTENIIFLRNECAQN
ncbi:hypothetical protein DCO58_03740 [Helicobacter saguini]|uniref:Uncharacterized protein n=1 Tax=Helicobacter saguini TaxID=1548018 RepID=A0A347VSF9_9HELI|nr:hypothetical protein [Helicobacter saguini]MWV62524.1 hypothetical protein [Helicobacter saguini]MWV66802.1 hypothetical protein [Helicobacter saguini]MWV69153.1 hypothetical protein [Helicobacter saguini]MWV71292.1 hypothetical protein [Helicobacter saguini]TLD94195.1 hypothetical protein LS64_006760 [Helicobacter saguini]